MLILASKSPRRQELLRLLRVDFQIMTEEVDETMDPSLPPEEEVRRVSALKAQAVTDCVTPQDTVISADTIVVLDGQIMGKPKTEEQAVQMLRSLSGRTHRVMTGLTVRQGSRTESVTVITEITFRELSEREITAYVRSGEPMDKAGAYGIQGGASVFVSHLSGDYFNVMGLPVCTLTQLLRSFGVSVLEETK